MGALQTTIEKQRQRSGRSAHQVCNLGHRSGVCGLMARRSDWLLRISDLLAELEMAMGEIDALTGEIEGQGEGEIKNEALQLITGAPCLEV